MNQYEQAFIDELKSLFSQANLTLPFKVGDYQFAYNHESVYIRYRDNNYTYGYCERGQCSEDITSENKDIVLYYPIRDGIPELGFGYELQHRRYGLDGRIITFGMMLYYIELLDKYQLGWREKLYYELEPIMIKDKMPIEIIQEIGKTGKPKPLILSLPVDETIDLKELFTIFKCLIKPYLYRWK
ncbi:MULTISPECIES: hypothetical protein [unclassified Moraxella]|uniref:hypothetical protein n=1 Tax=unclassified Moraxella TaxID=2685852 RepID=UPI003AF49FA4